MTGNDERGDEESSDEHGGKDHYVVFVDGIKDTVDETVVPASRLIEVSQDNPENFDLVALRGRGGGDVRVFDHNDEVDLSDQHRKHFDTKGDGKNYV